MTHSTNDDPLLTLDQAAEYAGVSRTFLRREIAAERLEGTFLGRLVRVRHSALERYLDSVTTAPTVNRGR